MNKSNAKFWDRMAKRYARQPVGDEKAYQYKLEKTREYLTQDSVVLEVGCGTASTAIVHSPYVKVLHALDISTKMLDIASERAAAAEAHNIEFIQADVNDWVGPAQGYDLVMAHSLLHLLEDRTTLLAQLFALLRPRGVFVSSTICMGNNSGWLPRLLAFGSAIGLLPGIGFFSEQDLLAEISAAGFELELQWQPGPGKAIFVVARKP